MLSEEVQWEVTHVCNGKVELEPGLHRLSLLQRHIRMRVNDHCSELLRALGYKVVV